MLAGMPYTGLRDAIIAHPTMAEGLGDLFSNGGRLNPELPRCWEVRRCYHYPMDLIVRERDGRWRS
jgi:hypothetical protein